ncbi:hypothetical protein [Nostoc sp.]
MSRNPPDDDTLGKQWAMSGDKKQSFYAFLGYQAELGCVRCAIAP